jgi:lysophospholipid hydrolase
LTETGSAATPSEILHSTVTSTTSRIIFDIFVAIFGHVPWFILRTLSLTVTLTLDFWGLFNLLVIIFFTLLIVYRYRIFNSWSRLPEVTAAPRNAFDLKPDATTIEPENRYPDEFMNAFLSSIKVFGYLDRPVFHELSKNLKTRKLKSGQVLFSEDDDPQDFYVVVEGKVSVYIKQPVSGTDDEEVAYFLTILVTFTE